MFIELKYYGHDKNLEEKVVNLVEATGMESNIVIMSLLLPFHESCSLRKCLRIRVRSAAFNTPENGETCRISRATGKGSSRFETSSSSGNFSHVFQRSNSSLAPG